MTRLRVVVVTYEGGPELLTCLRACLASRWPGPVEVVLVDNGSRDGSVAAVQRALPQVRVITSPGNVGFPGANQALTDLAGVGAVALVNPDAVVAPDCLALLGEALAADPRRGAACPRILLQGRYREVRFGVSGSDRAALDLAAVDTDGSWHLTGPRVRRRWRDGVAWTVGDGSVLRTSGRALRVRLRANEPVHLRLTSGDAAVEHDLRRRAAWLAVPLGGPASEVVQNAGSLIGPAGVGRNRGYHQLDGPPWTEDADVPAWCGAAVLLRPDYLRDVGLLDPRWFLYYEDADLSWRGLLRGWRYRYVAAARVHHAHTALIGHGSALYEVQHVRNRILTVTKNAPAGELPRVWGAAAAELRAQVRADLLGRLRDRRLPEPVPAVRRLRGMAAAARATPAVLRERRAVRRGATVADEALPVLGRWVDPAGG